MSDTTKHLDGLSLSLLADDMLPKETAEAFHKHMETCPQCEQAYDDMQAMSFALARLPSVEPPDGFEGFSQGIMEKLPEQDGVDLGKTIEIAQSDAKISFWANLDWKQVVWYAAVCAVGFNLMYRPPELVLDDAGGSMESSVSRSGSDTLGATAQGAATTEDEAMSSAEETTEPTLAMSLPEEDSEPVSGDVVLSDQIDPSLYEADFEDISFSSQIYMESEGILTEAQIDSELQWLLDMSDLINLSVVVVADASAYESLATANWAVSPDAPSLGYCFMMQEDLGEMVSISPKLSELAGFDTVMVVMPLSPGR